MPRLILFSIAGPLLLAGVLNAAGAPGASPEGNAAVLLSFAGQVDAAAAAQTEWASARVNQTFNPGDRLRTARESRATLRLSNLSVLRVQELTTLIVRPPDQSGQSSVLDLRSGAIYFFDRDRPSTRFRTPTVSGAIRGTEFQIEVADNGATRLTLLDGEVELFNDFGEIKLTGGEQASIEPGQPPRKTALIDAINIIQWTLYYPAVLNPDDLYLPREAETALAASLAAYQSGDLPGALASYPEDRQPASPHEAVYRAALLLAIGNVAESEAALDQIPADSGRPAALANALREMLAAVRQQPWQRTAPRELSTEWLAGSYHEQSRWRLDEALQMARSAQETAPRFAFASARRAELELSFGHTRRALEWIDQSLEQAPRNAQALALKGFLLSALNRFDDASSWFEQAIAADGALGNAWLGRGLVRIRRGEREAGREDLQIAAALEPTRSLFRSYLGKAFSETSDPDQAARELELARRLDPADPTPPLYSALLHHQRHRVNQAVRDLERSRELNDNRRLFRSRMLLDQDRAVRSANLAAIYRDAGMTDFSVRESARAVQSDYASYSARLFLANSYDALRDPRQTHLRHETPWLTELLIANLLAPAGAFPLSQNISQQEYSRFFETSRLGLLSYSEYQSRGDWLQQASQYGAIGNSSYAVDVDYRSSRGQRINEDIESLSLSGKFKHQITAQDSLYLHVMHQDREGGDLLQYYNPAAANPVVRFHETSEPNIFAGYHREWRPGSHTLLLGSYLDNRFQYHDDSAFLHTIQRAGDGTVTSIPLRRFSHDFQRDFSALSAEAQQIHQINGHTLVAGVRAQGGSVKTESSLIRNPPTAFPPIYGNPASDQTVNADFQRTSIYLYDLWQVAGPLHLTAGLGYDSVRHPRNTDFPPVSRGETTSRQLSPKAGLTWTPRAGSTVRAAYTRSLGGLFYDSSVRLEPAQIAGFTQLFRSMTPESIGGAAAGTRFTTYGIGFDQALPSQTYLGIEAEMLESNARRDVGVFDFTAFTPSASASTAEQRLAYREQAVAFNVNQLIGQEWALGARYRLARAELNDRFPAMPAGLSPSAARDLEAVLHQTQLFAIFQHHSGIFLRAEALWHGQSNHGYAPEISGDSFWQFNAFAGYRFPRRQAEIRIGLLNISGRDYRLNPLNLHSELPRERTFVASLRLNF